MYSVMNVDSSDIVHYGIKGMRWGHKKARYPSHLSSAPSDSSVTKRVKNDYNNLGDKDFTSKYKVSKKRYAKRVAKYGDPYKNGILPKISKHLPKINSNGKSKHPSENLSAHDRLFYGERGAARIKKHQESGMSRKKATRKEFSRQVLTGVAIGALAIGAGPLIAKGGNAISGARRAYNNASILDASGNVVKEFHSKIKVGETITKSLMRR